MIDFRKKTYRSLALQIPPALQAASDIPQREPADRDLPEADVVQVAVLRLHLHGALVVRDGGLRAGVDEGEAAGAEEEEHAFRVFCVSDKRPKREGDERKGTHPRDTAPNST